MSEKMVDGLKIFFYDLTMPDDKHPKGKQTLKAEETLVKAKSDNFI